MNATATADTHAHDEHGHHHVASFGMLMGILIILLIMTALTVWTAKFVDLGDLGNLILAMFIATFKATLVCAIFMHLLHDKLLNSVILVTCIGLVVCFIGFTAIDMKSRGALDPTREHFIGPPPLAQERIDAAIAKAHAEHAGHDDHAEDGHDDDHAVDGFTDEFKPINDIESDGHNDDGHH